MQNQGNDSVILRVDDDLPIVGCACDDVGAGPGDGHEAAVYLGRVGTGAGGCAVEGDADAGRALPGSGGDRSLNFGFFGQCNSRGSRSGADGCGLGGSGTGG